MDGACDSPDASEPETQEEQHETGRQQNDALQQDIDQPCDDSRQEGHSHRQVETDGPLPTGADLRRSRRQRKPRSSEQSVAFNHDSDSDDAEEHNSSPSEDWKPEESPKKAKRKRRSTKADPETEDRRSDETSEESHDSDGWFFKSRFSKCDRIRRVPKGFVRKYARLDLRCAYRNGSPYKLVPINVAKANCCVGERKLMYLQRQAEVERRQMQPGTKEHRRFMLALPEVRIANAEYDEIIDWKRRVDKDPTNRELRAEHGFRSRTNMPERWEQIERERARTRRQLKRMEQQRQTDAWVQQQQQSNETGSQQASHCEEDAESLSHGHTLTPTRNELGPWVQQNYAPDMALREQSRRQQELIMQETERRLTLKFDEAKRKVLMSPPLSPGRRSLPADDDGNDDYKTEAVDDDQHDSAAYDGATNVDDEYEGEISGTSVEEAATQERREAAARLAAMADGIEIDGSIIAQLRYMERQRELEYDKSTDTEIKRWEKRQKPERSIRRPPN